MSAAKDVSLQPVPASVPATNFDHLILQEIAEQLRETIRYQSDLLLLMKNEKNHSEVPALTLCLDRFNDDLFGLSDRLNDLAEANQ